MSCVFFAGELILLTIITCQRQQAIKVLAAFILFPLPSRMQAHECHCYWPCPPLPTPLQPHKKLLRMPSFWTWLCSMLSAHPFLRGRLKLSPRLQKHHSAHWMGLAVFWACGRCPMSRKVFLTWACVVLWRKNTSVRENKGKPWGLAWWGFVLPNLSGHTALP